MKKPKKKKLDPIREAKRSARAVLGETLWAALKWAADRGRRFERARLKKTDVPDDDFY
jgi:hypothetical protein